jgi:hypothetical protein
MSTSVTPEAPTAPTGLAEAGAALKQATTWESLATPAVETVETPAEASVEVAAGTDAAATLTSTEFNGYTVDEKGGLHRPDGTMASTDEISAYNLEVSAEQPAPTEPPVEAPAMETVKILGRNGTELEIEVSDPLIAEAIRSNIKDGMRGEDYRRKIQAADEHLADKRAFEQMIETNPEGLIFNHLPEDKQISLAVKLVSKYWDQIAPDLMKLDADPVERVRNAAQTQQQIMEQQRQFEQMTAASKHAVQLEHAVRALIPEHATDTQGDAFLQDAGSDIRREMQRRNGAAIPPADVAAILSHRLALYGFDKPAPASTPTPTRPVARAVAKPNQAPTAQPSVMVSAGAQVRRTVTAQRVAAAVPPAGAGAATVRAPLVPPNSSIEAASRALKKQTGWQH